MEPPRRTATNRTRMNPEPTLEPLSEEETWQRTARLVWVPFVARLLLGGPVRGDSPPLPSRVEALTLESVEAVSAILNRAVWQHLARTCGWRERRCVAPDGRIRTGRLWQVVTGEPKLRFTEASIELLLTLFRATRGDGLVEEAELPVDLSASGDLLFAHLVFRSLHSRRTLASIPADYEWATWMGHPLNALWAPEQSPAEAVTEIRWDWLSDGDLALWVPWLLEEILVENHVEARIWSGPARVSRTRFQRAATVLRAWMRHCRERERIDWLVPFFLFFARAADRTSRDQRRFEDLTGRASMRERQELATAWADWLELTEELAAAHGESLALHPVEREAPVTLFLSAWEESRFGESLTALRLLRSELRPTIS